MSNQDKAMQQEERGPRTGNKFEDTPTIRSSTKHQPNRHNT